MSFMRQTNILICFILFFSGCSQKFFEKKESVEKKSSKKQITYALCNKHKKIMIHASKYIEEEFKKAYFLQKDIIGAKAQLFLIEQNSPTVFAKNINAARISYKKHFDLAKQNGCSISEFEKFPLEKIKESINSFEKEALQ